MFRLSVVLVVSLLPLSCRDCGVLVQRGISPSVVGACMHGYTITVWRRKITFFILYMCYKLIRTFGRTWSVSHRIATCRYRNPYTFGVGKQLKCIALSVKLESETLSLGQLVMDLCTCTFTYMYNYYRTGTGTHPASQMH